MRAGTDAVGGSRRAASRLGRRGIVIAVALATGAAVIPLAAGGAGGSTPPAETSPPQQEALETALLDAVRNAHFDETIDYGPVEDRCPGGAGCPQPAQPVAHLPNVDLAVIELDADGNAVAAANVLLSRDHPDGVAVALDEGGEAGSFGVSSVRWRRWDIDRANGGTFDEATGEQLTTKGWDDNPARTAADDILAGRDDAPIEFMSPYPASLFKLIIAFRVMRLVDMGELELSDVVVPEEPAPAPGEPTDPGTPTTPTTTPPTTTTTTAPNDGPTTTSTTSPSTTTSSTSTTTETTYGGGSGSGAAAASDLGVSSVRRGRGADDLETAAAAGSTVEDLLASMITYSDNPSARTLVKLLSDMGDLPKMHAELRSLGLGTLQVNGTDPATGGNWQPGQIHMTAMDTARLLWLIDGGNGRLWERPDGEPVEASILSDESRAHLKGLLAEQGYHEALSTGNLCGAANVSPGIPASVPARWIDDDGIVHVDGYDYGHDVRPCNEDAEVTFAHKAGSTYNYGSDAGIVVSKPGAPERHYIIAFLSSLGYRYTDAPFAAADTNPCYVEVGLICYTQRIPAMAREIDEFLSTTPADAG